MRRIVASTLILCFAATGAWCGEPVRLNRGEFDKLHNLIKRQPGESRWMEIDWYPSVWEARQRAAAEGKPIFIMAGSGGAPVAGC